MCLELPRFGLLEPGSWSDGTGSWSDGTGALSGEPRRPANWSGMAAMGRWAPAPGGWRPGVELVIVAVARVWDLVADDGRWWRGAGTEQHDDEAPEEDHSSSLLVAA